MIKFLTPDTNATGSTTTDVSDTHVRHVNNVPNKDADLLGVSKLVNEKWAASPFVSLIWKTQPAFAEDVSLFDRELAERNTAGGGRNLQTQNLENLDIEIEDALPYVKSYISEKFGPPNAVAHYAEFGFEHRNNHYDFARDRQKRKSALLMMVSAIHANEFDAKTYGTAFWTDIKTRYDAAITAATAGAGSVSNDVGTLVPLRTSLRRVLHSILLILEANYPDTFVQARRDWGFQKSGY